VKCHSRYPQFSEARNFIQKMPAEILLKILQLRDPPHTRESMHRLSELTHVCRFWRAVLVNQPRMWSTIFAKREDSRGFVEMCAERSQTTPLDVMVDASGWGLVHLGCTCDRDDRERLLPNERNPCEWHFPFEALATPEHSKRIRTLDVDFKVPYGRERGARVGQLLALCFDFSPAHYPWVGFRVLEALQVHILPFPLCRHHTLLVVQRTLGRLFHTIRQPDLLHTRGLPAWHQRRGFPVVRVEQPVPRVSLAGYRTFQG